MYGMNRAARRSGLTRQSGGDIDILPSGELSRDTGIALAGAGLVVLVATGAIHLYLRDRVR